MTARSDAQGFELSARVELFALDLTALGGGTYRFTSGLNELKASIVWQGDTYAATPIAASGFERTGSGAAPRPKIQVANIGAVISALCETYDDLVGAKLTRTVVLAKYLDAVNFSGGVNPDASADGAFPAEIWFIFRKSQENRQAVEFELCAPFDVEGVMLPRRQVRQNSCAWIYRSAECTYSGGAVADETDTPTAVLAEDKCGKRLASCRLRFPVPAELPYGGFPAAGALLG